MCGIQADALVYKLASPRLQQYACRGGRATTRSEPYLSQMNFPSTTSLSPYAFCTNLPILPRTAPPPFSSRGRPEHGPQPRVCLLAGERPPLSRPSVNKRRAPSLPPTHPPSTFVGSHSPATVLLSHREARSCKAATIAGPRAFITSLIGDLVIMGAPASSRRPLISAVVVPGPTRGASASY